MFKKVILAGLFSVTALAANADSKGSDVVVSMDGIQITQDDIKHYIKERIASGTNPETFNSAKNIAQAGENLLSLRRLGKMAREAGVSSSDQIEWELALQRERLQTREWVQGIIDKEIAATDWESAAREEYLANPNAYIRGKDEIKASHILIDTESRTEEEAKALAEQVLTKVKAGEDFAALAAEYSDDPSAAKNKGDLGYFSKGRMVPEFDAAAFALSAKKPVSDLVKTQFGYHIIKFVDARQPKKLIFDEAKASIIAQLQREAPRSIRNRLTMEARSTSTEEVVVNEAALRALEQEILGN